MRKDSVESFYQCLRTGKGKITIIQGITADEVFAKFGCFSLEIWGRIEKVATTGKIGD
jgi:hypothetical protein